MKCEICGKDILKDSQCIDYKYYHNDCIINLTKDTQKYKEVINKTTNKLYEWGEALDPEFQKIMLDILKGDNNE